MVTVNRYSVKDSLIESMIKTDSFKQLVRDIEADNPIDDSYLERTRSIWEYKPAPQLPEIIHSPDGTMTREPEGRIAGYDKEIRKRVDKRLEGKQISIDDDANIYIDPEA